MENFLLNILPISMGVLFIPTYVAQIIKTVKTKDVSGISPSFWILLSIILLGLTISTGAVWYYKGAYGNFVIETINLSLALVMLVLVAKYRKKDDE